MPPPNFDQIKKGVLDALQNKRLVMPLVLAGASLLVLPYAWKQFKNLGKSSAGYEYKVMVEEKTVATLLTEPSIEKDEKSGLLKVAWSEADSKNSKSGQISTSGELTVQRVEAKPPKEDYQQPKSSDYYLQRAATNLRDLEYMQNHDY